MEKASDEEINFGGWHEIFICGTALPHQPDGYHAGTDAAGA